MLHDVDGGVHLAVTVEGDPGADIRREQGRFLYFQPDEVTPLEDAYEPLRAAGPQDSRRRHRQHLPRRRRLRRRDRHAGSPSATCPDTSRSWTSAYAGVHLAYQLLDGYDTLVLVDATARGGAPGTLYLIEHDVDRANPSPRRRRCWTATG